MLLLRAEINTELVSDSFIVPIRDKDVSVQWLLSELLTRYHAWHPFKVYEFEIASEHTHEAQHKLLDMLNISETQFVSNTISEQIQIEIVESEQSKIRRKQDEEKEEELRLERIRIEREKQEKRKKRISEISLKGNCWELSDYSQFLNVPLYAEELENDNEIEEHMSEDMGGRIVVNTGSLDQWCSIRFIAPILPSFNKFYFSVRVLSLPATTNTWKVCIGAVPIEFNIKADRHWIGSQHSWSYIAGTGGKCYNSGKSVSYGQTYKEKDVISVLLNFEDGKIEFFKNGKSQGVAFENLKKAVIPAVSMTAKGCKLQIIDLLDDKYLPEIYQPFMIKNVQILQAHLQQKQHYLSNEFELQLAEILEEHHINQLYPRFSAHRNPASLYFSSSIDDQTKLSICNTMTNHGSGDKWRIARSFGAYYPKQQPSEEQPNVAAFEFVILNDAKSSNTWRICCGVIPIDFESNNDKIWVGAQSSYAYISGTGGKCFNSAQSNSYGERYGSNDRISVLLDFSNLSLEFFKNNESQGIAYEGCSCLESGVYAAVSVTASNAKVRFNSLSEQQAIHLKQIGITQRQALVDVTNKYGNIWDAHKLTTPGFLEIVENMYIECKADNDQIKSKKNDYETWNCVASRLPYQSGRRYFEIELIEIGGGELKKPSNSQKGWKICIGVVPKTYNFNHSKNKQWVGAQNSFSLVVGNGQKCFNSAKSAAYTNEQFERNDTVGVLMDFDNHTLEFYKNEKALGEAFNNLYGPVYAAVSVSADCKPCRLKFRPNAEDEKMEQLFLFR
eukprot:CAMPEP_0197029718 /NCGR_PEP_ID=MMETSP1384-20130603/9111_1 /TAXON_ID=29189 /ORGANISM="Ammonia sp." /LENGTH=785 /DNA_ID=CAMNT_0042458937 /DNA_START=41 /DNA_END=2398 /DNA_ORIENTATION=+